MLAELEARLPVIRTQAIKIQLMYDSGRQKVRVAAKCALLLLLYTDRIVSILHHVIGRSARARAPMAESRLVRALVPSHSYVQGSRFLPMARHLTHPFRIRFYDPCMDDLCCSVGCDPCTPPTSCLGRTTSIIVLPTFFSPFLSCTHGDYRFSLRCLLSWGFLSNNVYYYSFI